MIRINRHIDLKTDPHIEIYDVTPQLQEFVGQSAITNGQALVFSCHTTTAIAINEYEERLLHDLKLYLQKLAPPAGRYRHNDLHLRDVPDDEPINAHSHLMAMTLGTSETIPIIDGKLALGRYQSLLFFELDGPRDRRLLFQLSGD